MSVAAKIVPPPVPAAGRPGGWVRPGAFVALWSTGYVAGPIALRYAPPFTMLCLRFAFAAMVLAAIALAARAPWPRSPRTVGHIVVAGLLTQALQFGGAYAGMKAGVPGAVAALIAGLMPIVTAILAFVTLAERLTRLQWTGLFLGFGGVALVVASDAHAKVGGSLPAVGAVAFGTLVLSAGTVYQKRFCAHMDPRSGGAIQLAASTLLMFVAARTTETMHIDLTPAFGLSLGWLVVANSVGGMLLLLRLIRDGAASRVASLFYLIPPVSAVMTALALGERYTPLVIVGFAAAALGVALTTRSGGRGQGG